MIITLILHGRAFVMVLVQFVAGEAQGRDNTGPSVGRGYVRLPYMATLSMVTWELRSGDGWQKRKSIFPHQRRVGTYYTRLRHAEKLGNKEDNIAM